MQDFGGYIDHNFKSIFLNEKMKFLLNVIYWDPTDAKSAMYLVLTSWYVL